MNKKEIIECLEAQIKIRKHLIEKVRNTSEQCATVAFSGYELDRLTEFTEQGKPFCPYTGRD